jgi:hypothetical protein
VVSRVAPTGEEEDLRGPGLVIDLEKLESHARDLYLGRFVEFVKQARGEHGRYLRLRPGDETAIRAADDGSAESLAAVRIDAGRAMGAN